jgi:serine protease Do
MALAATVWAVSFPDHNSLAASPEPDIRRDASVIAVEKVMPSVVNIATETVIEYEDFYQRLFREFFGQHGPRQQQKEYSVGSGVIIDEDGYVLTNFHVVRRANRTQVKLWDGREYEAVPVVATPQRDVALLKIQAKPGEKFKAIKLAADDDLFLGETVLALGNPFGLGGSVTKGILSSKSRRPATGNEPLDVNDWLQTDAAINPGNSGGPLVNIKGDLIGLNVAVYREGQGIGFAIPVRHVSEALMEFFTPEVQHLLWVGLQMKAKEGAIAVTSVQPNSPAGKAGLREGDRVVQVNGHPVTGVIQTGNLLAESADAKGTITYERGGERKTVSLRPVPFERLVRQKVGIKLTELNPQQVERLGVEGGKRLLIEEVEPNSPAAEARIRPGFLLTQIDGVAVDALFNVGMVLSGHNAGDSVKLTMLVRQNLGGGYFQFQEGTVAVKVR